MISFHIPPVSNDLTAPLKQKIDGKTKPSGALGKLETTALTIGRIQNTLEPRLRKPTFVVFAGDHGIAREGVSPFPPEVTPQMVLNFLAGGAAINVFCRQHGIRIQVVDAGVNFDFAPDADLIHAKIAKGTRNFLHEPAMSLAECEKAIDKGAEIVATIAQTGCNIMGFGEMGIANTSSAAVLMSLYCGLPVNDCIGRGTGLNAEGLHRKTAILSAAVRNHPVTSAPLSILRTFGGLEIAMMCGAMLQAAAKRMILLIDGFIATAALLAATRLAPHVLDYCIFTHVSDEKGHQRMLDFLQVDPLIRLDMRLGEGTGAAVAYPLVVSAVAFLNEMASFESAGVSQGS